MALLRKVRAVKNKVTEKLNGPAAQYIKASSSPIEEDALLLEAGQGQNLNGNMFALVRACMQNEKWRCLKLYWVVADNELTVKARERFAFYNYKVRLVVRNTTEYCRLLAVAKYLLTDNSFPVYFKKRSGQIYLNTWHGTPLKHLGKSNSATVASLANVQKNFLMADYALFPNRLTWRVFMEDYMLRHIFRGQSLFADYPRNDAFLNEDLQRKIRKESGLEDVQIIAYLPTWRGTGRQDDIKNQTKIIKKIFDELDVRLRDNQVFYVNLHFLMKTTLDFSSYHHIKPFPENYETYDFLAICDMLVTDYSSVFFDFANTQRKIIMFAYDWAEYMRDRGMYLDMTKLPFPIVQTVDELVSEINCPGKEDMQDFLAEYCSCRDVHTSHKVMQLLLEGKTEGLRLERQPECDLALIYVSHLGTKQFYEYIVEKIAEITKRYPEKTVVICYRGKLTKSKVELLNSIPGSPDYLTITTAFAFTFSEWVRARAALQNEHWAGTFQQDLFPVFERERERLLPGIEPSVVVNCKPWPNYFDSVLETFPAHKIVCLAPKHLRGTSAFKPGYAFMIRKCKQFYDEVIDEQDTADYKYWETTPHLYNNNLIKTANLYNGVHYGEKALRLSAWAVMDNFTAQHLKDMHGLIAGNKYPLKVLTSWNVSGHRWIVHYSLEIPYSDIMTMPMQNRVHLAYCDSTGFGFKKPVHYLLWDRTKSHARHSNVRVLNDKKTCALFNQRKGNILSLAVREAVPSDYSAEARKMAAAWAMAKVLPASDKVLMFEKESARYEESASIVFERLHAMGYENVYFVLDPSSPDIHKVPEQYRRYIIDKNSFTHYLEFFRCKTFIGSEMVSHGIELHTANRFALQKLNRRQYNYVFLQHGVMYMISLDSESRKFFKNARYDGKYRIVVSSQLEAEHFIKRGNYKPEQLYICGLPKFDVNTWDADADRIAIMTTWRPWEINEARQDVRATRYYQMVERIFEAVPEKLRNKVLILPHPLIAAIMRDADLPLSNYIQRPDDKRSYDEILRTVKVLITDYSSISYDAYYRGSNVIFYWEEKDECMAQYGPSTVLMLDDEKAFGDVCYNQQGLRKVIESNYYERQRPEQIAKYKKLVSYHDGHNTDRLIEMLKEDELI